MNAENKNNVINIGPIAHHQLREIQIHRRRATGYSDSLARISAQAIDILYRQECQCDL